MKLQELGSNIRMIVNNVNTYISDELKEYGIGHGQFEYLMLIFENEGISLNEIARIKVVTKASVTKAVNKLLEAGYVVKADNPLDKRANRLYVTQKTQKIVSLLKEKEDYVNRQIFEGFSEHEKESLLDLLIKLRRNTDLLRSGLNE